MIEVELKEWGNSIGLILPAQKLRELKLQEGDRVSIEILSKVRRDGFGIAKGARPFEEEEISHEEFW